MSATLRVGTLIYIDGGVNKKNKFQYTHTHVLYFKNKINPHQTGTSRLPSYWNTTEQTIRICMRKNIPVRQISLYSISNHIFSAQIKC